MASGFLIAFYWATKSGQFEDDYTPSVRILFDDDPPVDVVDDHTEISKTASDEKPNQKEK